MAIFKTSEEIGTPENMNKVLKDVDDEIAKKVSLDENGNLIVRGNIIAKSGFFDEESVWLGDKKVTADNFSTATNETKNRDLLRYSFMVG